MPVASIDTHEPTVADRVIDAARRAAHFSHEARLVRSMAGDAIEDGVHAARRAMKSVRRGVETLEDLQDETVHYIKRQPFKAVGIAVSVGLLLGGVVGWIGGRFGQRQVGKC